MHASANLAVIGFLLYLGVVPLLLRLWRGEPAATVLASAIAVWLISLAAFLAAGRQVNFWAFSATYGFLALCFLMVFGAIYKSISLRLVAHVYATQGGSARVSTLEAEILEKSYQERLALILERGYANRTEDDFALTPAGHRIARRVGSLQRAFRIMRSG